MTSFVPFADATHNSLPKIPATPAMQLIALYATGTVGIEATAADVAKYRAAGTGVVLIDQTPGLKVFAAGLADVADVEFLAGTHASAAAAVLARQAHGWQSTLYCSKNALAGLQAALLPGTDRSKVLYGVADYNWSRAESEALLGANPHWAYCQYGDPKSNPHTLVPGTSVTLAQANADIDVGKASWAGHFMPARPSPVPVGNYFRNVADGSKSLQQVAAEAGGLVLGLLEISSRTENQQNRLKLNDYVTGPGVNAKMPPGLVYYTYSAS